MKTLFKWLGVVWDAVQRLSRAPIRACVDCYHGGKFPDSVPIFYAFVDPGACEGCGRAIAPRDSVALDG